MELVPDVQQRHCVGKTQSDAVRCLSYEKKINQRFRVFLVPGVVRILKATISYLFRYVDTR
jgi:hypothetical protein